MSGHRWLDEYAFHSELADLDKFCQLTFQSPLPAYLSCQFVYLYRYINIVK